MSNPRSDNSLVRSYISFRFTFFNLNHEERQFLLLMTAHFFIAEAVYPYLGIVMWIRIMPAGFSAITNDAQIIFEDFLCDGMA